MRRSIAFGLALCLGWMMAALNVPAAPPVNDQCFGAEIIPGSGGVSSITTNIHEATLDGDPPQPTNCYPGQISRSIWYQFAPDETGLYTVSLKYSATTMQDTLLGIYTSPGACSGPFEPYACNDDIGALQSAVTTNFNAGTTYYAVIWHTLTNAPAEGQRSVQLKVTKVVLPPNDFCAGAEEIPSTGPFPWWTTNRNGHLATNFSDPAAPTCGSGQRSLWYKFRPATGGNYIIATCTNNTTTKVFNTIMAVYSSSGGCEGTLTELRCNPGFCGTAAAVIMNLTPNTDYYIVVWDVEAEPLPDETDVQLFVERQGLPSVRTLGHSNLTPTSVTLIGEANPKGSLTRGYFEWGLTPAYGEVTGNSTLGAGITPFPYSRAIIDMAPDTTIYYRAAANNSFGTAFGEGRQVTLPLPEPVITLVIMETTGLRIQFTGSEGYTNHVEFSTDLVTWNALGTANHVEFDQFEFLDPTANNTRPPGFYRIKL